MRIVSKDDPALLNNQQQQQQIHLNAMTNGTIIPSSNAQHNADAAFLTTQNLLLKQMFAENATCKPLSSSSNVDSRLTRIKHSPDGAVQITYKNMVQSQPQYTHSHPVFILPKTTTQVCSTNYTNTFVNAPFTSSAVATQPNGFYGSSFCNLPAMNPLTETHCTPTKNITLQTLSLKNPTSFQVNGLSCSEFSTPTLPNRVSPANGFRTSNSLTISLPKMTPNENKNPILGFKPPIYNFNDLNQTPGGTSSSTQILTNNSTAMTSMQNGDPMLSSSELNMELDSDLLSSIDMNTFEKELGMLKERMTAELSTVSDLDRKLFDSNHVFMNDGHCGNNIDLSNHVDMQISPTHTAHAQLVSHVETSSNHLCNSVSIIDVSPETVSTSGGNKVILVGSWNAKNARYHCKFGETLVDAELIQNGVLKCYSPIMEHQCKVRLCVLTNDVIASNSVDFEFVDPVNLSSAHPTSPPIRHDWLYITNENLKTTLKERFSSISEILAPCNSVAVNIDPNTENFEDQLIDLCKKLIVIDVDITFDYNVKNTMTLLHISSALGYMKLIQFLINWVESNTNIIIQAEAAPMKTDEFSMLPIMWSAARGHFNTSCVLLQWHEAAIQERDFCGCTAIDLARECGHESLVDYLERIKRKSLISRDNSDAHSPKLQHTSQNNLSDNQPKFVEGSPSLRTLGRTLAHIQSILNEETEKDDASDLNCSDDEDSASLFESSYSPVANGMTSSFVSSSGVLSINPSEQSPSAHQSPFNRQIRETAEFCEFFYQAKKIEKDFAELTLTDEEQEDLYRAANVIQTAYKTYKERRQRRDQELSAAVLIQSYYRRYKQYAAFKKMQKGALVIQSQYRAHREKSRRKCHAASVIQSYYRKYKQRKDRMQIQADRHKNNRYLAQISKRFSQEIPDMFLNDVTSLITSTNSNIITSTRCNYSNLQTPIHLQTSSQVSLQAHPSES